MRRPFEVLVNMLDGLTEEEMQQSLGELSHRWNEPIERIMDALDAGKMLRGQRTYIGVDEE